jgi:sirohydrochlorin cobaltochelatase
VTAPARQRLGELRIEAHDGAWLVSSPGEPGSGTRENLHEWARFDASGDYRPLPGARNLRPGLSLLCHDRSELDEAIDAIYPLAATHLAQFEQGELRVVPLDDSLERQTGRYESARSISTRGRQAARTELCGRCVKVPLWAGASVQNDGDIPCPEACSVMISLCREVALWEQDPPAPAAADSAAPFAAFETPGNQIRESVLAALQEPAP